MSYFIQATVQSLMNGYLSLDKEIEQKLKPLHGKILEINIKKTPFHYGFLFAKNNIEVISADKITADAVISADLLTFLKLFKSSSLSNMSKLSVTGDQVFSEAAYHVLHELDIDWEEILSHYTGDVVAHKIGRCVEGVQKWFNRGANSFKESLTDYLQEELRYFPSATELNDFMEDVDELKSDLDRLSVRLSHYEKDKHE